VLAALTAGGGITGYIRTGSIPSVVAGVLVGALVSTYSNLQATRHADLTQYGVGGYRIAQSQPYGIEFALLASVVLAGSSIPRAIKTQKPLPAGLSILALYGLYTYGQPYLNQA
jgi:uncharacterized membrane protein (UPF0136 family)